MILSLFLAPNMQRKISENLYVRFLKNVLDKINSSKNLQKQPHQFAALRKGRFAKF